MSIEQDMRALLRDRADSLTTRADLWEAVRTRRARHRRRRRALVTALAAVILSALSVAVLLRPPPAIVASGVELAAPEALPDFPLTPTWEPSWVGPRSFSYAVASNGTEMALRYEPTFPVGATLSVTVTPASPGLSGAPVDVSGRPAILAQGSGRVEIAWERPDGWVHVSAAGRLSSAEILTYAEALKAGPLRLEAPFTVTSLPSDARLMSMDRSSMVYARAADAGVRLTITLVRTATVPAGAADGQLVTGINALTAYRQVDRGRSLKVEVAVDWQVTPGQAANIARGTDVTAIAITTGG